LALRAETKRLADAIRRIGVTVHGALVVDRSDGDAIVLRYLLCVLLAYPANARS
jgi:hypothetical protein